MIMVCHITFCDHSYYLTDLRFVKRVDYTVGCNWKVFVDNYLDGGYHVPVLHKDLTTNLDISSYATQVDEYYSVQKVSGDSSDDRIGKAI